MRQRVRLLRSEVSVPGLMLSHHSSTLSRLTAYYQPMGMPDMCFGVGNGPVCRWVSKIIGEFRMKELSRTRTRNAVLRLGTRLSLTWSERIEADDFRRNFFSSYLSEVKSTVSTGSVIVIESDAYITSLSMENNNGYLLGCRNRTCMVTSTWSSHWLSLLAYCVFC